MSTPESKRRIVPIEEAIVRIGDGEDIHTFMTPGMNMLLGADHDREELIANMRKYGVEEAGEQARAMGHTLVIVNYRGTGALFIEAKESA